MKTRNEELEEIIDMVVKLVWAHTIFRTLFRKETADSAARYAHPEFFLAMHDSLLCSFCVAVEILFEEKEKATSLWSLIRQSTPKLSTSLVARIKACDGPIKDVEAIRHQVCAHRLKAKSPQDVFAEVRLRLGMMTEIANLARSVVLELAGEIDSRRKAELEKQQLSESTLSCVADDAEKVLRGFRLGDDSATSIENVR